MRRYLSCTPANLITEIRIARIKELLEKTSFPLKHIARLTGFKHNEHMATFFRKLVGVPPGHYRAESRANLDTRSIE